MGENIITIQDVVDEITSKRQLKRLVVLPYELKIMDVFPENITVGKYSALSVRLLCCFNQPRLWLLKTPYLKIKHKNLNLMCSLRIHMT